MSALTYPYKLWNQFWFKKEPVYQLAIFRIALGLFVLLILVISFPNWQRFYGPQGSLPYEALKEAYQGYNWSLFALSEKTWWTWALYAAAVFASITVTIGFKTRISTILLFTLYASMLHRNPFLINGQDQVATMLLFFSCFAPLGTSYSLDEFLKRFKPYNLNPDSLKPKLESIWGTQLMQVSITIIYIFSGPAKYLDDITWRNGSAIYYVSLSDRWFRFPQVDIFHSELASTILTFGTLIAEIAFPIFVWFKITRPFVLLGIAGLHFSLMIFMSVSVFYFNLMMLVSFILFIPSTAIEHLSNLFPRKMAIVFYDGQCTFCTWVISFIKTLDARNKLKLIDLRSPKIYKKFKNLKEEELTREMYLKKEDGGFEKGFYAFRHLTRVIPSLWLLIPVFYFPGAKVIGPKVYQFISDNRFRFFKCRCCGETHTGDCPLAKKSN